MLHSKNHLYHLESEAMHIMREVVAEVSNPVMLYTLIFAILAPKLVSTNIGMSKELLIFLSIYLTNKNYLLRS